MDREAKLLREVERAIAKFKDDTYGYCEGTDEPIGFARLVETLDALQRDL